MRQRAIAMLTAFLFLLPSCGKPLGETQAGGYVLYFIAGEDAVQGAAVRAQPFEGEGEAVTPGMLLDALVSGPTAEDLNSPFPAGLTLSSWYWDEERQGTVIVNFSEQYSGLTGISLTLADYCVVLTLSQLEGVQWVEIIVGGRSISYRNHHQLSEEEVMFPETPAVGENSAES